MSEGRGDAVLPGTVDDDGTPVLASLDGVADGGTEGGVEGEAVGVAADLVALRDATDVVRVAVGSPLAEGSGEVTTPEGFAVTMASLCPAPQAGEFAASGA